MKVLFFGDVYSKPGREAVKIAITKFRKEHQLDFIIMNGENATHGKGITPEMAEEFFNFGVDAITLGNHAWDQKQIIPYMSTTTKLIRPLNYPDHPSYKTPGRGSTVLESKTGTDKQGKKHKLALLQVMGRVFMDPLDCPFRAAEKEIEKFENLGIQNILVDFHGEASSEKMAFAFFVDGKVSAVLGTHSHIQTADERILKGGTAAITDVGMCGDFDSVIGVKKEIVIEKFLTKRHIKYEAAEGPGGYGCVLLTIDEDSGKTIEIKRFRETIAS